MTTESEPASPINPRYLSSPVPAPERGQIAPAEQYLNWYHLPQIRKGMQRGALLAGAPATSSAFHFPVPEPRFPPSRKADRLFWLGPGGRLLRLRLHP